MLSLLASNPGLIRYSVGPLSTEPGIAPEYTLVCPQNPPEKPIKPKTHASGLDFLCPRIGQATLVHCGFSHVVITPAWATGDSLCVQPTVWAQPGPLVPYWPVPAATLSGSFQVHFLSPQGTPASAWCSGSRAPSPARRAPPAPASHPPQEKRGKGRGRGSRQWVGSLDDYYF